MAAKTNVVEDIQGQLLDAIRKSQEAAVETVRNWTEAIGPYVPKTGTWPLAEQFPSPAEVADTAFDFVEELLKTQREFVHRVLGAAAPVAERVQEQGEQAARQGERAARRAS